LKLTDQKSVPRVIIGLAYTVVYGPTEAAIIQGVESAAL